MSDITLSAFHDLVADALGRGSSFNSVIPQRVAWAARWIERNYTFQYMRQWKTVNASPDADYPYIITLYDLRVKEIELLRRRQLDADGVTVLYGRPLKRVKPQDRESRGTDVPESYWLNGVSSIILNTTPDEEMTFEGHFVLFTKWGTDAGWTHWLLDNATQLLLARTLMLTTVRSRDPKLWDMYKAEVDLEIQSFTAAEEAFRTQDFVTVWEPPEYAEHDESLRSA